MNLTAKAIISKFGGQTELAKSIGKKQGIVGHWASQGIPAKWQKVLLDLAQEKGIDLTPSDFFATIPESIKKDIIKVPKMTHFGNLTIGNVTFPAYVLDNGQRVLSSSVVTSNFFETSSCDLNSYLDIETLKPFLVNNLNKIQFQTFESHKSFIDNELNPALDTVKVPLVRFDTGNQGFAKYGNGLPAELLISICIAFSELGETETVTEKQKEIARKANKFIAACAMVGITALVDEATGYQYDREEDALQTKLRAFLADSMREWEKTFPDELWIEFARLTGWKGNPKLNRPQWWGKLVNELIYGYLDKDVLEWLKTNVPKPIHGQNYHQWLNSQYGLKKLVAHLWQTIGMAGACENMNEIRRLMAHKFGGQYFQASFWLRS